MKIFFEIIGFFFVLVDDFELEYGFFFFKKDKKNKKKKVKVVVLVWFDEELG